MTEHAGRLLGIDYGLKVVGLALSDPTQLIARPYDLLHRTSKRDDFAKLNALIAEHGIAACIVGLPESPPEITVYTQADRVRLWASRLAAAIDVPVYLWNERYSTQEAEELLAESGSDRPDRVDAVAAAVILQGFLDARRDRGIDWPAPVPPAEE
jgi:putative Holliday junction resolvase